MKVKIRLANWMLYLAFGGFVRAGVGYWDSNDSTPGAGATPTGTWGANSYWSTNADGEASTTAWTPNDTAVFSAGTDATNPFTVFVYGNQTAGGITFEEGATTLSGGTITLGGTPFPILANVDARIDSTLAGPRVLTKSGTGTLTLNGTNTYTLLTIVSNGVLAVGNASALGSKFAGTTIQAGAALEVGGGIALNEPLTVFGTGIGDAGAIRSSADSNWISSIQLDTAVSQSGVISTDAGTLALGRVSAGNKYALTFVGDGDIIVSGADTSYGLVWGGEGGGVTKKGSGTMTINGLVTTRGSFIVLDGVVRMGNTNRFSNAGGVYPDLWVGGGFFDLNGYDVVVDGLRGNGSYAGTVVNSGTSTLVVGTNATLAQTHAELPGFPGVIQGGTTLRKEGPRTQVLAGHNMYTGDTIINAGTLRLYGAASINNSPNIRVAAGAVFDVAAVSGGFVLWGSQTLMGGGTVIGMITVGPGGQIRPGNGVGKKTFESRGGSGGLDLNAGGIVDWELAANSETGPGTNFDQIVMTGSPLTLGGESLLRINFVGSATEPDGSEPFWQTNRTWHIISSPNVVFNFAEIENGSYAAGNFSTSIETNGVWLNYTPGEVIPPGITSTSATWAVTQRIPLGSTDVVRILRDPLRPWLYVIDRQNSKVLFISSETGSVAKELYVGADPTDCDIDASGNQLYVANKGAGTGRPGSRRIGVVALTNQTLVNSYLTPVEAVNVTAGRPGRLYYNAGYDIFNSGDGHSFNTDTATDLGSFAGIKTRMVISSDETRLYGQYIYYGNLGQMGVFNVSSDQITLVDYYPYSPYPYGWDYNNYSLSGDDRRLAYGQILFDATNLTNHIGVFPEQVFALNHDGSMAFGQSTIWDTTTFPSQSNATEIAKLPFSSTVMAFDEQANVLYVFRSINGSLYAIEPATAHGIPFQWLAEHGLGTNYVVEAEDPDNDGLNNLQEWVRDSNPTNATPPLKLDWMSAPFLTVRDTSVTRWYQLQRKDNLVSRNWQAISQFPGTGSNVVFDVTPDLGQRPRAFYRLRVKAY